ncbi:MAG TPA: NAD/NADP octopine/nopaline dehydrogenase family protein, partial [Bacillota bacterium]
MKKVETVTIVGGGNGAFIAAADLAVNKGLKVNLFEAPELAKSIEGVMQTKTITLTTKQNPGIGEGVARLNKVTSDPEAAVKGADVVFVVIPAFGQRRMAELLGDYLTKDQVVVLEPGNFGGSLEFAQVMLAKGKTELPILVEFQCMSYTGWKDSPTTVWTSGFKKGNWAAAFPANRNKEAMAILHQIYPDLIEAQNVFETGMSNVNTVFHAPMMLCNVGWLEHTGGDFMLYWDGDSKSVGHIVQAVDDERMSVGRAAGMNLEPCLDIINRWYGYMGCKGKTLWEAMTTNPAYALDKCPSTVNHRFFTEDIPYGMIPLRDLGKLAGVPTPNTAAVATLVSTLLQRDLEK